ncbi:MAG: YhcH/YjgK/YiaL family protein [Oscillospiraceae bacterium]|nr:YhcH/YjgK/YiaL family protein [Oscillospiraceae bacterium]
MIEKDVSVRIANAIRYVKSQNLLNIPVGKYDIDSSSYFTVQAYQTKEEKHCKFESHKKYIDIHLIAGGAERIKVCSIDKLSIDTPYNADDDVALWVAKDSRFSIIDTVLEQGSYIVLYPEHAHMPSLEINRPESVKKVVIKVKI